MPALSSDRATIFTHTVPVPLHYNGFPDFYAILGVERDASFGDVEAAIVDRGADLLAANFSRRGGSELIRLLERYLNDFRAVLLDAENRRRYDDQLARHQKRDINALSYSEWRARLPAPTAATPPVRGWRARLRRAFWESEYF